VAGRSEIEWTEATWNPVTGCTKISAGCAHCYAERMARRLTAMGQPNYANGFKTTVHPHMLSVPLTWSSPRRVFVNSMGDLFHKDVPFGFIKRVYAVMREAQQHVFQVLTKRSGRLAELAPRLPWPSNVWMGVTIERCDLAFRADDLRRTPAVVRFLSLEPLLGRIPELDLTGIHWVIVGGESGPGARPMAREWVTEIRDACRRADVPFFFKQWGGTRRKAAGRLLDGVTYDEMPRALGRSVA
jgi:protein gp37